MKTKAPWSSTLVPTLKACDVVVALLEKNSSKVEFATLEWSIALWLSLTGGSKLIAVQLYDDYLPLPLISESVDTIQGQSLNEEEIAAAIDNRLSKLEGSTDSTGRPKPRVFIVHGHDMATLTRLELVLHRIGAEPITLRKAPKAGSKTWIELLEEYLPSSDAVIVLMTPDDEGRIVNDNASLSPRVRENVLVEAGYTVINNRERSLLIALGGVSIPSDFDGIARIQSEMWDKTVEPALAKRLEDMGLPVSVSNAV